MLHDYTHARTHTHIHICVIFQKWCIARVRDRNRETEVIRNDEKKFHAYNVTCVKVLRVKFLAKVQFYGLITWTRGTFKLNCWINQRWRYAELYVHVEQVEIGSWNMPKPTRVNTLRFKVHYLHYHVWKLKIPEIYSAKIFYRSSGKRNFALRSMIFFPFFFRVLIIGTVVGHRFVI